MGRLLRKKPLNKKKKSKESKPLEAVSEYRSSGVDKKVAPAKSAGQEPKKKPAPPAKKSSAERNTVFSKGEALIQSGIQFLREVQVELKKVTWPTRRQTIGSTVVVIVLVILISLFLGAADMGLSSLMRWVLN